jgi:hypothetical protein
MRRTLQSSIAVSLTALAFASTSDGAPDGTGCNGNVTGASSLARCIIGSASAAGDYATTIATGTATRPRTIEIVIYTSSTQRGIDVAWNIVCTRGLGAGSKSGQFTTGTYGKAPPSPTGGRGWWTIKGPLKMPMAHPDSCIVSADAQLSGSGSIKVQILAVR